VLALDESGLFCARGGFHVDPERPVARAVFTSEERRIEGCGAALVATPKGGEALLGDVKLTFHPSGFSPLAAQVRLEAPGEVWVVTGDWKRAADPLAAPFEPLACDVLVLRAPFALPIFLWDEPAALARWLEARPRCTLFAPPVLALRLQAQLGTPLRRHEDLEPLARRYEAAGVPLPASDPSSERLLAPLAARAAVKGRGRGAGAGRRRPPRDAGSAPAALVEGAARLRGPRRRANVDAGFALSEHADWEEILRTVAEVRARRILVQGAHADALARFLREERSRDAAPLAARAP